MLAFMSYQKKLDKCEVVMSKDILVNYLLQLGDSALITGQRLCELCGRAPALEEEIALMNLGLDLVGQARNWLDYTAEIINDGRSADDLAFRRDERAYRNLLLVEQHNGDYAVTTCKLFFYDVWHYHTLQSLTNSKDEQIVAIAAKAIKEVSYHLRRSREWVKRFADGTVESRERLLNAIEQLWRFTYELENPNETAKQLFAEGIITDPQQVASAWRKEVADLFASVDIKMPEPAKYIYLDGSEGMHTELLGIILAEMQFLPRAYPDAVW